jgi:hypothetical protein
MTIFLGDLMQSGTASVLFFSRNNTEHIEHSPAPQLLPGGAKKIQKYCRQNCSAAQLSLRLRRDIICQMAVSR